ncbi:cobalt-precorrin-5B (C(1))-methyltransferase CbiD [Sulfurospirillum arcachonense]|uniref:cobalt-precorrin-5B (C(1))-methyltransferase CbiD n=1 Tax=Sulfurospirillum arcachonense TaxID=57666 RepID=UPI000468DA16|nr:cobalt-precorrin-5B (C(1))-methyltransferase CbiD [Sulfurospirillum arcachonense]
MVDSQAQNSKKLLKKGYSTGMHASFAFSLALESILITKDVVHVKTNKMDNDDLDVTKGCEIVATISHNKEDLKLNPIAQQPHVFSDKTNSLELYAGIGVGVVTKKGLKIQPNFPAINPVPLQHMEQTFKKYTKNKKECKLFCTISVSDGEVIAKQTANEKVGVLGGISILGTTGFVKPISSSAYLDSIQTEINFAKQNGFEPLVFTLGNSALHVAQKKYKKEQIIEIGNFVYDAINIAQDLHVKEVIFLCGIGKMTKIYQGFKNTHNRYGIINLNQLKLDIQKKLFVEVDTKETLTVKGIAQQLDAINKMQDFYAFIAKKANQQLKSWFTQINVKAIILEEKEVKGW